MSIKFEVIFWDKRLLVVDKINQQIKKKQKKKKKRIAYKICNVEFKLKSWIGIVPVSWLE